MQSAVNATAAIFRQMQAEGKAKDFRMDNLFISNPFQDVLEDIER